MNRVFSIIIAFLISSAAWADLSPCLPLNLRGEHFQTVAMSKGYQAIDRREKYVYLDEKHREMYHRKIIGGKVTAFYGGVWAPYHNNSLLYVMDSSGEFYTMASDVAFTGNVRHSSFFAGKPVAAAGNMKFFKDRLVHIDNGSGHYKPTKLHLQQALASLVRQGVDISEATIAFGGNAFNHSTVSGGTPLRVLFQEKGSRECIENLLRNSAIKDVKDLRILQALDRREFNHWILELEKTGEIVQYDQALKTLLEESPHLKQKLPIKTVNRYDPDFVRRSRWSCALGFLKEMFVD